MRLRRWIGSLTDSATTATTVIVGVLVASAIIASLLASQAISAARSRQAVSEAMVRQYAELAAWEFSREARKDVSEALNRTLGFQVHPPRHGNERECDCVARVAIDSWFELAPDGTVIPRS